MLDTFPPKMNSFTEAVNMTLFAQRKLPLSNDTIVDALINFGFTVPDMPEDCWTIMEDVMDSYINIKSISESNRIRLQLYNQIVNNIKRNA